MRGSRQHMPLVRIKVEGVCGEPVPREDPPPAPPIIRSFYVSKSDVKFGYMPHCKGLRWQHFVKLAVKTASVSRASSPLCTGTTGER